VLSLQYPEPELLSPAYIEQKAQKSLLRPEF